MKWSATQESYQQWVATPYKHRPAGLRTLREFCNTYGITENMATKWVALPGFEAEVFYWARTILTHRLPNIISALAREAESGSIPAATLAFKLLGIHNETVTHKVTIEQERLVVIMSPTDLEQLQAATTLALPGSIMDDAAIEGVIVANTPVSQEADE
jgi:hypothetical protein